MRFSMKICIIISLIIGCGALLIIFYNISSKQFTDYAPNKSEQFINNNSDQPDSELSNPSAVYCIDLGYQYQSEEGICIFEDAFKCDAWSFLNGECGQKYTFCEKSGGKIIITDKNCQFSPKCAICILQDGIKCNEWNYFKGKCP